MVLMRVNHGRRMRREWRANNIPFARVPSHECRLVVGGDSYQISVRLNLLELPYRLLASIHWLRNHLPRNFLRKRC